MRLTLLLVLLAMVMGAAASAAPAATGLRGLYWTTDARTLGAGRYSVGLLTHLGISSDERDGVVAGEAVEITDTEYDGTAHITAGFGLGDRFELGAAVSYLVNQLGRGDDHAGFSGEWEGDDGFSEARISLKYGINPDAENLWFSLMPSAGFSIHDGGYSSFVVNGDGWDGIWEEGQGMFEMRRPMINSGSYNLGMDLLASWKLDPVVLHANIGYHWFRQNFQFTDARWTAGHVATDQVDVDMDVEDPVFRAVAGMEYPLGETTTLMAEAEWRHFMKRDFEDGDGEDYDDCIQVSPGIRFGGESGFTWDLRASFALSSFAPNWSDLGHGLYQAGGEPTDTDRSNYAPFPEGYAPELGIGIDVAYTGTFRAEPARVSGRVYDAETGENLPGTVANDRGVEASTAGSDGRYATELPAGDATLTATADGYLSASQAVQLSRGGVHAVDFALQPIHETGIVTGTVRDASTGDPLSGTVSRGSIQVQTGSDGRYSIEIPAGPATLTASAAGYSGESADLQVPGGGEVSQDFDLQMMMEFENVYFEFDRDVLTPDAKSALDVIAGFLTANPSVAVRITGHADAIGEPGYNRDLSERRAETVRAYLISRGVSDSRLSTVSYGEEQPAVPNDSEANRALNRRAEFIILGRGTE